MRDQRIKHTTEELSSTNVLRQLKNFADMVVITGSGKKNPLKRLKNRQPQDIEQKSLLLITHKTPTIAQNY